MKEEINKRFDERFNQVEFLHGVPVSLPNKTKEEMLSFLHQEIERAVAEREKEIVEIVEGMRPEGCSHGQGKCNILNCPNRYVNQALSDILSLLTKKK